MTELENYRDNLEENVELRKVVSKLEDLLSKKHSENENMIKLHQEFKILNDKTRKECTELNQKLILSYSEKSNIEKKYESEINRIKNVKIKKIKKSNLKNKKKYTNHN